MVKDTTVIWRPKPLLQFSIRKERMGVSMRTSNLVYNAVDCAIAIAQQMGLTSLSCSSFAHLHLICYNAFFIILSH